MASPPLQPTNPVVEPGLPPVGAPLRLRVEPLDPLEAAAHLGAALLLPHIRGVFDVLCDLLHHGVEWIAVRHDRSHVTPPPWSGLPAPPHTAVDRPPPTREPSPRGPRRTPYGTRTDRTDRTARLPLDPS